MIQLERGRQSALRDLDAIISRLHGLDNEDWNRATPNDGWDIRDLAAHLTESVQRLTDRLTTIVTRRLGHPIVSDTPVDVSPVNGNQTPQDLIVALTHRRNIARHVLIALEEEDLDAPIHDASIPPQQANGLGQLTACVFEFGIHRYDLDAALDEREAGLPREAIIAADDLYASRMVEIATTEGKRPLAPIAYHFDGALIDRWLTWDGHTWSDDELQDIPLVHVQGDESAIALFICGRIPATDQRLGVRGDRDMARTFKEYVPGPFRI